MLGYKVLKFISISCRHLFVPLIVPHPHLFYLYFIRYAMRHAYACWSLPSAGVYVEREKATPAAGIEFTF